MQSQTLEQLKIQLQANAKDIEEREALKALSEHNKGIKTKPTKTTEERRVVRATNAAKGRAKLAKLQRKAKRLGYNRYVAGMDLSKPAVEAKQTPPDTNLMTGITGKQYVPLSTIPEDKADKLLNGLELLLSLEEYHGFIRGATILGLLNKSL